VFYLLTLKFYQIHALSQCLRKKSLPLMHRHRHRGSGSAAMDISDLYVMVYRHATRQISNDIGSNVRIYLSSSFFYSAD
jgi:hypothetical protein